MEIVWDARNFANLFDIVTLFGTGEGYIELTNKSLSFFGMDFGAVVIVCGKFSNKEFKKTKGSGVVSVSNKWVNVLKKRFDGDVSFIVEEDSVIIKSARKIYRDKEVVSSITDKKPNVREEHYGFIFGNLDAEAIYIVDIAEFKSLIDKGDIRFTAGKNITCSIGSELEEYKQTLLSEVRKKPNDTLSVTIDSDFIKFAMNAFSGRVILTMTGTDSPIIITKVEDNRKYSMIIAPKVV